MVVRAISNPKSEMDKAAVLAAIEAAVAPLRAENEQVCVAVPLCFSLCVRASELMWLALLVDTPAASCPPRPFGGGFAAVFRGRRAAACRRTAAVIETRSSQSRCRGVCGSRC